MMNRVERNFDRFLFTCAFMVFIIYFLLFSSLFYIFEPKLKWEINRILNAVKNSLLAAIFSTFLASIIGVPTAYFLSRYKNKFSFMVDIVLEFPLIISPAALGAAIIVFLNTPLGKNLDFILFTFYAIVLAQFITVLGLFIRILKISIDQINYKYEQISYIFGANKLQSFLFIILPMCKKGLLAAIILSLAKAFGEFGATLMVAGSIPYKTETIPIYLYLQISSANINQTIFSILLLLSIGFLTILLARKINS